MINMGYIEDMIIGTYKRQIEAYKSAAEKVIAARYESKTNSIYDRSLVLTRISGE